jgi:hypothetical protein
MSNKETFRPYGYFLYSYIYFFEKNGSNNYVQNCLVLYKNHKEFWDYGLRFYSSTKEFMKF